MIYLPVKENKEEENWRATLENEEQLKREALEKVIGITFSLEINVN